MHGDLSWVDEEGELVDITVDEGEQALQWDRRRLGRLNQHRIRASVTMERDRSKKEDDQKLKGKGEAAYKIAVETVRLNGCFLSLSTPLRLKSIETTPL